MKLNVQLTEANSVFPVTFLDEKDILEVKFNSLQILHVHDYDYYSGDTYVVPKFILQILKTTGKLVREDILVASIPVNSVSNPQGGITVTIGG